MDQGYYMQPMVVAAPQKDNSTVALVLEAVCGLFGLYGIGWLIGGYTTAGILLLAGGLLFGIFLWIAAAVGAVFTAGLTLACPAILNIAVLLTSTLILNSKLKQRRMGIAG